MYFSFCRLKNGDLFQLVRKHHLYGVIHDMIEDLVKLDEDQAISLFLEKGDDPHDQVVNEVTKSEKKSKKYYVSPDVIVAKLERSPRYQYKVSKDVDLNRMH